jgi:hypothetical protein
MNIDGKRLGRLILDQLKVTASRAAILGVSGAVIGQPQLVKAVRHAYARFVFDSIQLRLRVSFYMPLV